ncbi:hypothetical protein CspeluHIS016_0111650 [Cutaneotrichosporon spelunceum]|uniref:ubiquitinyl hydrolase 1 n=1 Tax=Cutaneotrichosporon spelunceum TaxID=1672016 RepID=A0AAD3YAC3_9TREE|nr:hypothetical protein CspeluHIS016_0111650 [Cutaneotrichosporon spelunceum]
MSRPPPTFPSVDELPYDKLHEAAVQLESVDATSHPPSYWFELAVRSAEAARNAQRRGSKAGQYVAYTRLAIAYQKCIFHKQLKEARVADHAWSVRVNEFKTVSFLKRDRANETFETAMRKAKALKGELKAAPVKTHKSTNSVDHEPGGSIADRMKALSGHGVDVSTRRISRDLGRGPPSRPPAPVRRPSQDLVHQRRPSLPRPPSIHNLSRRGSSASLSGVNGISPNPTGSSIRSNQSPVKNSVPLYRPASATSTASARQPQGSGSVPSSPALVTEPPFPSPRAEHTTPPILLPMVSSSQPSPRGLANAEPDKASTRSSAATPPSRPAHPLPTPPNPLSRTLSQTEAAQRLGNFEKAFPSLDQLGKQFDDDGFAIPALPTPTADEPRRVPPTPKKDDEDAAAVFLGFPNLPSVPTDLPGTQALSKRSLSPPPTPVRLDEPETDKDRPPSPPSPDVTRQNRPASTLGFSAQNSLALSPYNTPRASIVDEDTKCSSSPLAALEQGAQSSSVLGDGTPLPPANGSATMSPLSPREVATSPTPVALSTEPLTMPEPQPAPVHAANGAGPGPSDTDPPSGSAGPTKPNFPFTSSIMPETLRSYFLMPAVNVLICDVRSADEFSMGIVGAEYHARGCKVNVVWIDPTVLLRSGLTSTQLESALSLSPEAQQAAFASRHFYDLVVITDSKSTMFPSKGEPQTPAGNLRDIIYEHEFVKTLPRSPVLLVGGYEGWVEFIKARQAINMEHLQQAHGSQVPNGTAAQRNGYSNPLSSRQTNAHPIPERRPGHSREKSSNMLPSQYSKEITENFSHSTPQSMTGSRHQHSYSASYSGTAASYTPYQQAPATPTRPQMPRASHGSSNSISSASGSMQGHTVPSHNRTDTFSNYSAPTGIAPPPRASVHTSAITRRQSSTDYIEYGSPRQQPRIEYPQAHGMVRVPQPPPAAASHGLDRQDQRAPMRLPQHVENVSETEVRYWRDTRLGLTGLKNLGNTCYMNSTVQCLSATFPFTRFFLDGYYKRDLNTTSNLGTKGQLATAFASLLSVLWGERFQDLSPNTFRESIISFNNLFAGNQQHDSQEFLSFVLDGLHEDLNRVKHKPQIGMTPERERALETLPPSIASDKEWALYRQRDDSFIVDLFQGQYMSRTTCLTCRKTSTVYDSFMWLTLDLPTQKGRVLLPELIDRWVRPETLSVEDGWICTNCKVARKATKALTLVRLPPVLLIQLKRFSYGGSSWNRSDTPVIFPTNNLDLTRFVPRREPTGSENLDDPRTQIGPFKYNLYGVTNHSGTLSSGHYTAFVRDARGWKFAEDSLISDASERDVVSRPAASYILFYKRVQA